MSNEVLGPPYKENVVLREFRGLTARARSLGESAEQNQKSLQKCLLGMFILT